MENRLEETPLLGLASPQFVKDNPWYTIFADLKADDLDDKYIDGLEQYKTQVDEILGDSVLEILYFNKDIKEVLENVQKRLEELVKP